MNPHAEQENEDVRDKKISNATISDETVNNNGEPFCGTQVTPLTPLISDEALGEKIRLLNKLQREIFDFVNKWAIYQKKKKKSIARTRETTQFIFSLLEVLILENRICSQRSDTFLLSHC